MKLWSFSLASLKHYQKTMRILNVAEKNDAAKELSRIMSRGQVRRREGISKFNKIYEFNYNILNTNAQMVMTSVSGHLMGLEFNQAYRKWSSCSPLELFSAPVTKVVPEDFQKIKRTLEREVRGSQALIIWTDCDREGENIGFEIIEVCTKVCPRIKLYRARFSEITPQSVGRACANLVAPDNLQSEAVDVRIELDLRIGAAFTRFQTLRLQKVFPGVLSEQLISYGSCQFPTLGFVVDRYKQVQQFVPEQFYKIKVTHETPTAKVDFVWKRGRLFLRTPCLILYQMCLEDPTAVVTNTSSRPKSKWRPLPLDTVELEKSSSRKLRISAKETMKIAEKLYNQGFISYPRTETNIFPSSLNLVDLVQQQTEDANWGAFASRVVADGPHPRQGKKTDNAHPPIHPTKYTRNLQGNEKRLYEFIVRYFLACCSKDAVGRESSVDIEIAGEKFTATGLMILERNYLDVYPYDRWSDKTIPVYNQGERFQPSSIEMVDGATSPPPLLSEADLIALMEKHGIGTDATHAEHIETIKSRSYVGVQADGTFLPGKLGMGLVEGYDLMKFEFSKPRLRAELEADLKRIEDGSKRGADVLREQVAKYRESFVKAAQEALKLDQALSAYFGNPQAYTEPEIEPQITNPQVRLCPRCKQEQMTLRKIKEGNYLIGCLGFPNCRASIFLPKFVLEASVDDSICRVCGPGEVHRLRFTFKRGSVPPMLPLQHTGCIGGCDEMLRETLDLKDISNVAQPSRAQEHLSQPGQPTRLQTQIVDEAEGKEGEEGGVETKPLVQQIEAKITHLTRQTSLTGITRIPHARPVLMEVVLEGVATRGVKVTQETLDLDQEVVTTPLVPIQRMKTQWFVVVVILPLYLLSKRKDLIKDDLFIDAHKEMVAVTSFYGEMTAPQPTARLAARRSGISLRIGTTLGIVMGVSKAVIPVKGLTILTKQCVTATNPRSVAQLKKKVPIKGVSSTLVQNPWAKAVHSSSGRIRMEYPKAEDLDPQVGVVQGGREAVAREEDGQEGAGEEEVEEEGVGKGNVETVIRKDIPRKHVQITDDNQCGKPNNS